MPINAAKHIWYNGKLVPWEKATVHVLAHARFHGRGRLQVTECDSQWGLHGFCLGCTRITLNISGHVCMRSSPLSFGTTPDGASAAK